jgi:hypothetical protein
LLLDRGRGLSFVSKQIKGASTGTRSLRSAAEKRSTIWAPTTLKRAS